MGREEPSTVPPSPQAFRRAQRSKEAKRTRSKVIPSLLNSNARALKGVQRVELIIDPPSFNPNASKQQTEGNKTGYRKITTYDDNKKKKGNKKGQKKKKGDISSDDDDEQGKPGGVGKANGAAAREQIDEAGGPSQEVKIRIISTDPLTASVELQEKLKLSKTHKREESASSTTARDAITQEKSATSTKSPIAKTRTALLNPASPLRPGGGFLNGATSHEEFLCMRTTLLPSLQERFYRLPEIGCIYTPDVLVFRSSDPEATDLGKKDRFWIDVVSAGMLRFPDLEGTGVQRKSAQAAAENAAATTGNEDDGEIDELGEETEVKRYANSKDRESVVRRMRCVMRVLASKGVGGAVLGAWGVGAYGNPINEIASAWRKVLIGDSNGKGPQSRGNKSKNTAENLGSIHEIIFAIPSLTLARDFAAHFDERIEVEVPEGPAVEEEVEEEEDPLARMREELEEKIAEYEEQIGQSTQPARYELILSTLKGQLKEIVARLEERDGANGDDHQGSVKGDDSVKGEGSVKGQDGPEEDEDDDDDDEGDDEDDIERSDADEESPSISKTPKKKSKGIKSASAKNAKILNARAT